MEISFLLFFTLLGNGFLSNEVGALRAEKIIDGAEVDALELKYPVAVMYDPQEQFVPDLNPCTGAIVGDWHIATIAQCFYDKETGKLRDKPFYIAFSITNLWEPEAATRYIRVDLVIFPAVYDPHTPDSFSEMGNLAIVKLAASLELRPRHRSLKKLLISREQQLLLNTNYLVAGYGWNQIGFITMFENGRPVEVMAGSSDGKLRMATAHILDTGYCQNRILQGRIADGNMCVKIRQSIEGGRKGICTADGGAPLIYENHLVGLAIHGFGICNETYFPGIYINVRYYVDFFDNVIIYKRPVSMNIYKQMRKGENEFRFERVFSLV